MSQGWLALAVALLQAAHQHPEKFDARGPAASPSAPNDTGDVIVVKMPKRSKTGRIGELTLEEEDKLDKVINDFIAYDIASNSAPSAARQLDGLGAEAIPAIVRGINKSAGYSYSCPVTVLSAKLIDLIHKSGDPDVLRFIRTEVGAGVKGNKYSGLLNRVKAESGLRQAELARLAKIAEKNRPKSPGDGPSKDSGKDP